MRTESPGAFRARCAPRWSARARARRLFLSQREAGPDENMDNVQEKWIVAFIRAFEACRVKEGELVAILSESESRSILVQLSELALMRMKARPFHVVVPTPPADAPVPIRSTGHSIAIQEHPAVIAALS